jgi:predicted nucleic acid-binding protein
MEPLKLDDLPEHALLLVDTAPIVYIIEDHPELAPIFRPVFERHETGQVRFAVTTITLAEVLTGPLSVADEALAERYRATLKTWLIVDLDSEIAESAARLRATLKLKLGDAVQAASAIAINADALVTHDRDFSHLDSLRIIGINKP